MPFTSFPWPSRITEIDSEHEGVPLVTLMDIITYPQVTAKFKCIARVVAAIPWKVEDFCSLRGTYRVRITLEDPTARLHAYVYDDDGEVFFDGYPPAEELTRKWDALLGLAHGESDGEIRGAPRNPPWVLICVKSYYISKSDIWGSRKFRIFRTKLLVEC
uniref:POT1A/B-like OB fold domain-containing protein n=1 Tax=Opuntia streptacantha TaxID=393608 RepID=A0A7C8ZFP5_OPUST